MKCRTYDTWVCFFRIVSPSACALFSGSSQEAQLSWQHARRSPRHSGSCVRRCSFCPTQQLGRTVCAVLSNSRHDRRKRFPPWVPCGLPRRRWQADLCRLTVFRGSTSLMQNTHARLPRSCAPQSLRFDHGRRNRLRCCLVLLSRPPPLSPPPPPFRWTL